jgi:hypothetical protein
MVSSARQRWRGGTAAYLGVRWSASRITSSAESGGGFHERKPTEISTTVDRRFLGSTTFVDHMFIQRQPLSCAAG